MMSLNDLGPPNMGFQSIILRFQTATYSSRVNCVENHWRYTKIICVWICLVLNVFFNSFKFRPLRFKEFFVRESQIWVPFKTRDFWYYRLHSIARKRLQIDTDLLLVIASTADKLSGGANISDLRGPWNPKSSGFLLNLSQFQATTRVNCADITLDRWCRASREHYLTFL